MMSTIEAVLNKRQPGNTHRNTCMQAACGLDSDRTAPYGTIMGNDRNDSAGIVMVGSSALDA